MLTLPIKKKWFDMILSGEKKEEYREIKRYYTIRFGIFNNLPDDGSNCIMFRNGYGSDSPSLIAECSLHIGTGRIEWGAESGKIYYVLSINRIIEHSNIN